LPTDRPQGVAEHRHGKGHGDEARVGLTGSFPSPAEVRAAEKERQQPDRQKQDQGRAKSRRH
jgi:hypothetical protein